VIRNRTATRSCVATAALAAATLGGVSGVARPCWAINIVVDYTYDTSRFFGAGNPAGQGAAARASIEAAASFYSGILADTFSAVAEPPDFFGTQGSVSWDWTLVFRHPGTGSQVQLEDQVLPENVYRMYVGGRDLGGTRLGEGGTGGPSYAVSPTGLFSPAEHAQITQTTNNFIAAVTTRGEPSGFASWGGYISFDHDAATSWHFNHTTPPTPGANDFYSVALHEMAHALGIGSSSQWTNLATGSHFAGPAAAAAYGGPPPLEAFSPTNPTPSHWASGTMSRVLGTNTQQEALMDPQITQGTRKLVTALDAGALADIGWSVSAPTFDAADFNRDGVVNAADLGVWRAAFKANANGDADGDGDTDGRDFLTWQRRLRGTGVSTATLAAPEPASAALAAAWLIVLAWRRRVR
jgi:hypothetical protein